AALAGACARHGTVLAGGDLAALPEPGASGGPHLAAGLTLIGRMPPGGAWLARGAARPGDALWVGGTLGESAAGRHLLARGARLAGRRVELPESLGLSAPLAVAARRAVRRHLAPVPQLELGHALGRRAARCPGHPPAAIDLSDGLARDLHRLCAASGAGAVVEAERLPLPRGFAALCARLGREPLELALGGGEDYVLLFTLPAREEPPPSFRCRQIGTITAGRGVRLATGGRQQKLPPAGWDHLTAATT
ncbi:MAG TPA: AIR synthase-related protein, partial [Thermoanaerobaculia bacterium]